MNCPICKQKMLSACDGCHKFRIDCNCTRYHKTVYFCDDCRTGILTKEQVMGMRK